MSTVYDKTDNYALNLYGDNDPADLRDGYNGSMRTIDDTLEKHLNRIEGVESYETHDEAVMKALLVDNTVDNAAAAKTKWDKASADATTANGKAGSNTNILTALGADSVANATAEKTKWDGKQDARTECVFIGDSITAGYGLDSPLTDRYPIFVAQGLHETPHVFAQDGAGFVATSSISPYNTLTSLADQAMADTSYDHSRVGHVFLMGGINDGLDQSDQAKSNAQAILRKLTAAYPHAMIVFGVCPTCGKSRQNNKKTGSGLGAIGRNVKALHELQATPEGATVVFMDCWKMLWATPDATTDGLHPNKKGHKMFASQILSALHGMVYENPIALPADSITHYSSPSQYPDAYANAKAAVTTITLARTAPTCAMADGNHMQIFYSTADIITITVPDSTPDTVIVPILKMPQIMQSYEGAPNYNQIIILEEESSTITLNSGETVSFLTQMQYNRRNNMIELFLAIPNAQQLVGKTFSKYARTPIITLPII